MLARLFVAFAAALSWGHAVWTAGEGLPAESHVPGYLAAADAARALAELDLVGVVGGGLLAAWAGSWMAALGVSPTVLAASYLPFHVLAALGLWWGGVALGHARGGMLAVVAGLSAAGVLTAATQATSDFPVMACAAAVVGGVLAGRSSWLLAAAILAGLFIPARLEPWPLGPVEALVAWAQLALLAGIVGALLVRGDTKVLRLLAGATLVFGVSAWTGIVGARLLVLPLLAIATAGVSSSPAALVAIGAMVLAQLVGFHTARDDWPGRPAPTRLVAAQPGDAETVAAALDWLVANGPADDGAVATYTLHDRLHAGVFAVAAAERGLSLRFVGVDAPSDLGLVLRKRVGPTPREGWRTQLPPRAHVLDAPGGWLVELWDRGLPPESLLGSPQEAEARNHPTEQRLYALVDGEERGPLLDHASSVEVLETPRGFEAVYVRQQALWRAASADGLAFGLPRPLRDERGAIEAFDPAVLRLPDGRIRLFAAELAGDDRAVDPATHPTRIVSWTGADLDALVRDPGVRFEGVGLVDPFVVAPAGAEARWALYVTEARSRIVRAFSADGDRFEPDPGFRLDGLTVPLVVSDGLFAQLQVMGWSVLAWRPSPTGDLRLLEVCGTGPAVAAGRLYYTRAAAECPPPIAIPSKRPALGELLGVERAGRDGAAPSPTSGAASSPGAPTPR